MTIASPASHKKRTLTLGQIQVGVDGTATGLRYKTAVILAHEKYETTNQQATTKSGDDHRPTDDVIQKLSALGLIERVNGEWRVTAAGTAALESPEAVKQ